MSVIRIEGFPVVENFRIGVSLLLEDFWALKNRLNLGAAVKATLDILCVLLWLYRDTWSPNLRLYGGKKAILRPDFIRFANI